MEIYFLDIKPSLDRKFAKLAKKDKKLHEAAMKKAEEIVLNPQHYKNLRAPLQEWKRVHVMGPFVLAFSIDENTKTVTLEDLDHHDNIYKH